jgi:hypothetical protein
VALFERTEWLGPGPGVCRRRAVRSTLVALEEPARPDARLIVRADEDGHADAQSSSTQGDKYLTSPLETTSASEELSERCRR